ncbi:MAG: CARDB domain-containing protein [Vicinamibacterales bacterium]
MTRLILASVGAVALMSVPAVTEQRGPAEPPQRPPVAAGRGVRPVITAAERRDTSPPLRDIRAIAPFQRHEPEEREKRLVRRIERARTPDTMVQTTPGAAMLAPSSMSIEGIGNVNNVLPPDTNAAVGPNHYVQAVNVSFAFYGKSPSTQPVLLYGPADTSTIWTGFGGPCEARNDGDAIIIYDHLADRWVMSQLALPNLFFGIALAPFYQCLAISATPDPTGTYHRYQFAFNKLNDYPKLAVWPDAYYMTINQFSAISLQYAGQGVIAFDRQKMLAGLPATMQYYDLAAVDINLAGMLPATLDGPPPPAGSPGYFVQMDDDAWGYSADRLQLWRFSVNWTTPSASSFTGPSLLPVAPFDSDMCSYSRNCIPQRDTDAKVDAMSDRMMYRLQYRNFGSHESLVVNQTVDADGSDHAGIRWYEIRNPRFSPTLFQQGTYAPDGDHRWMGSVAMDAAGNLALGYSVSGPSTFPSIRYTGRLAADAPGVMTQGEVEVVAGGGSQTEASGRWGDYSTMAVDPADDCTFWYTQQYYAATSTSGWQTRIATFSFPSCGSSTTLPRVTVTVTAPAREQDLAAGGFTVARTGDTTELLTVSYSVSGSATPSSDYVPLSGVVTIPSGSATATIALTPLDDPYAEPDETVVVTLNATSDYVAATPSQAIATVVSNDLPADLVLTAISVPATVTPGAVTTIGDTTKNQGGGAAEASVTSFYFSSNVLFDANDQFLGSRTLPSLAAGASSSGTLAVTIPATAVTGTYYIIARADSGGAIPESTEANNTRFSAAVSVGPDLALTATATPATAGAGGTLTIADTTRNQGSVLAGPTATAFYLSTNALLDASDILLGTRAVGALPPGAVHSASTTVPVPANLATGLYYMFAKADVNNTVAESSEINNTTTAVAVRIGPDLTVSAMTAPSSVAAGAMLAIGDTTSNTGGGAAAASATRFYLSVNLSVDAGDTILGNRSVPELNGGASSAGNTSMLVPAATPAGSYWLIGVADGGEGIPETFETNNTRLLLLRVTVTR